MRNDIPYQNREISKPNPLAPVEEKPVVSTPTNPKTKLILILASVIIVLLITASIISAIKKNQISSPIPTPTPSLVTKPTDTPLTDSQMPSDLKAKFDQIDSHNQTDSYFTPPQIEPNIGN